MRRKHIIVTALGGVLLLTFFALATPSRSGDLSDVRIGFAAYGVTDGKRSLILVVTNGSSFHISQPDGSCELRGEAPDSSITSSRSMDIIACGLSAPRWGWWQLKPPKISSVAPGETFRFTIPVEEGPYTWRVTVPFATIPFRDRLPFALRSLLRPSTQNTPIAFEVSPPPIPPQPAQALRTASAAASGTAP
jgi:hypothetical protein